MSGYEQAAGYAVPMDETFRRVVDTLKQGREVEYGFLGVRPENLREGDLAAGRHGVRVGDVVEGTPARRFGLQQEDVITHVDERPIFDADGLVLQIGKKAHDAVVRCRSSGNGRTIPIDVQLTKYAMRGRHVVSTPAPQWRGMRVDYASTARDFLDRVRSRQIPQRGLRDRFRDRQQSPAWQEGLRPKRRSRQVDGVRVTSPKEFHAAVAGKTGPVTLRLIAAGDDHASLVVPPDPPAAPADAAPAGDKPAAAAAPPVDVKAVGPPAVR